MSKIYLINQYGTDKYKIGTTKNTNKRKKQLQTGNADELVVVRIFETEHPFNLEKLLHLKYSNKLCIGEWFELTDNDVFCFMDICSKLNSAIVCVSKHNQQNNIISV